VIDAKSCLGLVLTWYRFKGAEFILQGWFGFVGSHLNVWLRFGRRGLVQLLWNDEDAKIALPTDEKIEQLKVIVKAKHPLLSGVFCVADGLKQTFQCHADLNKQSMYCNGWTHDHCIANLFTFSLDGRIVMATINAPGSLHDSQLANWGGFYDTLSDVYDQTGGMCCVDSAFACVGKPFLIQSSQKPNGNEDAIGLLQMSEATALRQAAEWGMHAIQASFPRMTERIRIEENGERRVFLHLMPLLYNFRLTNVGLNQLQSTHCPGWSVEAEHFIHF